MNRYGPRDAATVLMRRHHRVALRWRLSGGRTQWAIYLDGRPVSHRELEDAAERYEHLRYRITERMRHA